MFNIDLAYKIANNTINKEELKVLTSHKGNLDVNEIALVNALHPDYKTRYTDIAAYYGNLEVLIALIENYDANIQNDPENENTNLFYCASRCRYDEKRRKIFEWLAANPHYQALSGITALHFQAVSQSYNDFSSELKKPERRNLVAPIIAYHLYRRNSEDTDYYREIITDFPDQFSLVLSYLAEYENLEAFSGLMQIQEFNDLPINLNLINPINLPNKEPCLSSPYQIGERWGDSRETLAFNIVRNFSDDDELISDQWVSFFKQLINRQAKDNPVDLSAESDPGDSVAFRLAYFQEFNHSPPRPVEMNALLLELANQHPNKAVDFNSWPLDMSQNLAKVLIFNDQTDVFLALLRHQPESTDPIDISETYHLDLSDGDEDEDDYQYRGSISWDAASYRKWELLAVLLEQHPKEIPIQLNECPDGTNAFAKILVDWKQWMLLKKIINECTFDGVEILLNSPLLEELIANDQQDLLIAIFSMAEPSILKDNTQALVETLRFLKEQQYKGQDKNQKEKQHEYDFILEKYINYIEQSSEIKNVPEELMLFVLEDFIIKLSSAKFVKPLPANYLEDANQVFCYFHALKNKTIQSALTSNMISLLGDIKSLNKDKQIVETYSSIFFWHHKLSNDHTYQIVSANLNDKFAIEEIMMLSDSDEKIEEKYPQFWMTINNNKDDKIIELNTENERLKAIINQQNETIKAMQTGINDTVTSEISHSNTNELSDVADSSKIPNASFCKFASLSCRPRAGGDPTTKQHRCPVRNGSPPARG